MSVVVIDGVVFSLQTLKDVFQFFRIRMNIFKDSERRKTTIYLGTHSVCVCS